MEPDRYGVFAGPGRIVNHWEITPVFSFRGYFPMEGYPTGTQNSACAGSMRGLGDNAPIESFLRRQQPANKIRDPHQGTRVADQAIFFATTTVMSSYCSRPPNSATLSTIALAISDAERDL